MLGQKKMGGFSLIEVMVSISILAVLMALATPSLRESINSSKIGALARSVQAGLVTARSEAVRRNLDVEFVLADEVSATAAPVATGKNWVVRFKEPPSTAYTLLEGRLSGEGGMDGLDVSSTASTIHFNGLGAAVGLSAVAVIDVKNPLGGACAVDGGPMRCLQVKVSPGGQSRLCDPKAVAGDSRAC